MGIGFGRDDWPEPPSVPVSQDRYSELRTAEEKVEHIVEMLEDSEIDNHAHTCDCIACKIARYLGVRT